MGILNAIYKFRAKRYLRKKMREAKLTRELTGKTIHGLRTPSGKIVNLDKNGIKGFNRSVSKSERIDIMKLDQIEVYRTE